MAFSRCIPATLGEGVAARPRRQCHAHQEQPAFDSSPHIDLRIQDARLHNSCIAAPAVGCDKAAVRIDPAQASHNAGDTSASIARVIVTKSQKRAVLVSRHKLVMKMAKISAPPSFRPDRSGVSKDHPCRAPSVARTCDWRRGRPADSLCRRPWVWPRLPVGPSQCSVAAAVTRLRPLFLE